MLFSGANTNAEKRWCMKIITEYEKDNSSISFDEIVFESVKLKKMHPNEHMYGTPSFWLNEDGSYSWDYL